LRYIQKKDKIKNKKFFPPPPPHPSTSGD